MRAQGLFPAVLRYERMGPEELRKMIKHSKPEVRKNLRHIDSSRTHLNTTTIGSIADLEKLFDITKELAESNRMSNTAGLRKMNRPTKAEAVEKGRPQDPWDPKALPWCQAIVSVNSDWMLADEDCPAEHLLQYLRGDGVLVRVDKRKGKELETAMTAWLQEEHGEGLKYVRWDWDEDGLHGHGAIAHLHEFAPTDRYAEGCWHWRPSAHPHFRNELGEDGKRAKTGYEVAQDSIGAFLRGPNGSTCTSSGASLVRRIAGPRSAQPTISWRRLISTRSWGWQILSRLGRRTPGGAVRGMRLERSRAAAILPG
jgi:hypothetical protein